MKKLIFKALAHTEENLFELTVSVYVYIKRLSGA